MRKCILKARLPMSEYKADVFSSNKKKAFEKQVVLKKPQNYKVYSPPNLKDSIKVQSQTSIS